MDGLGLEDSFDAGEQSRVTCSLDVLTSLRDVHEKALN